MLVVLLAFTYASATGVKVSAPGILAFTVAVGVLTGARVNVAVRAMLVLVGVGAELLQPGN